MAKWRKKTSVRLEADSWRNERKKVRFGWRLKIKTIEKKVRLGWRLKIKKIEKKSGGRY